MIRSRLKIKDILSYAIGSVGDSTVYNFVMSYFSFFLTTVAGVSPAMAGTIISAAMIWDMVTDPIAGYLLDRSKNKNGKRRPWILKSLIPMGASLVMMFLNVDMPQPQKNVYYLALVLVFWASYTAFNIPYYSFGIVLTNVDSERVKLAAYREVLGYVGIFFASSVPTFIMGKLLDAGVGSEGAWAVAGVAVAVAAVVMIFMMWGCTGGKERPRRKAAAGKAVHKGFLRNMAGLLKMKPYRLVLLCGLFTNVGLTLFNSSLLYYVNYNMGLGEEQAAVMLTVMNIVSIVFVPFMVKAIEKFTKGKVFAVCMAFSGSVMILAGFVLPKSVGAGCVYVALSGIGTCAFWMCIFNFLYDVADYDEFRTGNMRDGMIVSVYSFLLKAGGAGAAALQGFLLEKNGFDAALGVQDGGVLKVTGAMFTILPGLCAVFAGGMIMLTPLKDEKMESLRQALDEKRHGEEYSLEGFEDLVQGNEIIENGT